MGIGCQRNGYWLATNHLSGRGLCTVQPIKVTSAAGRCVGRVVHKIGQYLIMLSKKELF